MSLKYEPASDREGGGGWAREAEAEEVHARATPFSQGEARTGPVLGKRNGSRT